MGSCATVTKRHTIEHRVPRTGAASRSTVDLPAVIDAAERDPEVLAIHRRFSCERRQVMLDLLDEAVATGEIDPDTSRTSPARRGRRRALSLTVTALCTWLVVEPVTRERSKRTL